MFNIYGGSGVTGGTTIDPGTVTGQTAVWDGSKWIPTSDIFIDASGNVGIADITPTGRFSIEDDGTALGSVMDVYMDDGNLWAFRIYNRSYGVAAASPFRFFMNNAGAFQFVAPVDLILSAGGDQVFGNAIIIKASNDTGFGIALPLAKVHIVKTTEQLRIGYDATNYVGLAVDSAGTLTFDLNGTKRWAMGGTSFNSSVTAQGPALLAATPTSTAPNIRPNQSDIDTGIGWAGADQLSLIAGGVEGVRVTSASLTTTGAVFRKITTVAAATYDLLVSDHILNVTYTATAAVTSLTLPTAQTLAGRVIVVKDAGGLAGTNNITIDTEAAQTIDGAGTLVLNSNYQSVSLYCDGTNWFII